MRHPFAAFSIIAVITRQHRIHAVHATINTSHGFCNADALWSSLLLCQVSFVVSYRAGLLYKFSVSAEEARWQQVSVDLLNALDTFVIA